jgi:NAD(P)-dependent dehydrogenase (short-subunit alcohol dehydrogenase family)
MARIVVSGCSRGIGYELVQVLAEQGHEVIALSRNQEPIEALGLKAVKGIACDVSNEQDLLKVQSYFNQQGSLDALIHNAGKLLNKPFLEIEPEEFEAVYRVNVFGVARLTQLLLPFMKQQGHVVSISSIGGVQGSVKFAGLSAYSTSKAALIGLTELWAEEFKENGPAFNCIALGAVQTEMLEEAFPGYQAPVGPREVAEYIAQFALTGQALYNGKVLQLSKSVP